MATDPATARDHSSCDRAWMRRALRQAVASRDPAKAEAFATEHGFASAHGSYEWQFSWGAGFEYGFFVTELGRWNLNLLRGNDKTPDDSGTPSVAFTIPSLARTGLTEAEATEQGVEFEVKMQDASGWFTARRSRERHAAHKVLVEKGTGRILGTHVIGPGAEEQINLFAMAMKAGMTANQIKATIFAYPSFGSDIGGMV